MMVRVGVMGATGYAGGELTRLLLGHPGVETMALVSRSRVGTEAGAVFPNLRGLGHVLEDAGALADCRAVFLAMPHGEAMTVAPALLAAGIVVVDLGADYRLRDPEVYREWYGKEHASPGMLPQAVYGLPEFHRSELRDAHLVAAPGCYPTAALLGALPLVAAGAVDPRTVIVDAGSGVSGAGRSSAGEYQFAEVNENFRAYRPGLHRHTPEMEQELSRAAGRQVRITFTPHLVPMTRGILATIYGQLTGGHRTEDLLDIFKNRYAGEPFVRVLEGLPETKAVAGSNFCHLSARVDRRTGRALVFVAIDNLGKGAVGQAVQAFNLAFGFPETTGLERPGVYP